MRTLTGVAALSAAGIAATMLTGCGFDVGTGRQERSYDVPGAVTGIKVSGEAGVEITGSDSPGITVREELRWSNRHNKPKARHDVQNGTLGLSAKCGRTAIGFNGCGLTYRVRIPRNLPVNIDSGDSKVTLTGLAGALRLRTGTGTITASDLRTATLTADTGDGSIRLAGRADTLNLHSGTGTISATGLRSDKVTARSGDGRLDLLFAAPPTTVQARTNTGTVRLMLPAGTGYAVNATTRTGQKRIDPAVRQDGRSRHQINVSTGDGTIIVAPA